MPITRHKSCDGKIKYENKIAVEYHISSNNLNGVEDFYPCQFCGGFHIFTIPNMKKLSTKKIVRNHNLRNPTGPRKMRMKTGSSGRKRRKF